MTPAEYRLVETALRYLITQANEGSDYDLIEHLVAAAKRANTAAFLSEHDAKHKRSEDDTGWQARAEKAEERVAVVESHNRILATEHGMRKVTIDRLTSELAAAQALLAAYEAKPSSAKPCPDCGGLGHFVVVVNLWDGSTTEAAECPTCKGTGGQ